MNVTELITALEYFKEHGDGHLQLFSKNEQGGAIPINNIKIETSIIPVGIKYLTLEEEPEIHLLLPEGINSKELFGKNHKEHPTTKKYKKKITIEKHVKVIKKEKRLHKCFKCSEPVTQGTGLHATIPGQKRRKLIHKECRKELRKEGIIKKKRNNRNRMRKDFTGYNRRCLRCKLGKPSTDYTKGNHYCKECREEQRKNREKKT